MKSVSVRELLTAAVDGELSPAERKAAERLLRTSPQARALFAKLKADAGRVRALPRLAAPADLVANILAHIEERAVGPTPLPPKPTTRVRNSWLPLVMNLGTAASVLLVISAASYLYFASSHDYYAMQQTGTEVARSTVPPVKVEESLPRYTSEERIVRGPFGPPNELAVRPGPDGPEMGPRPRVMPVDTLTGPPNLEPTPQIESFDPNKIRVSQLFSLDELATDPVARKKLVDETAKDELTRLDLFCQSSPVAFERVVAELKAAGTTVIADAFVQERLRKKVPTEVMIFTESLSPADVTALLQRIAEQEAKSKSGEFGTLVAAPFLPADLDRLGKLLGVANVFPKPAKGKAPVDIRKPLPEGTANQLAESLTRLANGGPRTEKVAVAVAYSPMGPNPAASKEIKQFLDRRGVRPAGAKPLMLVLRTQ